jgi:hypothetical protein
VARIEKEHLRIITLDEPNNTDWLDDFTVWSKKWIIDQYVDQ